MIKALTAPMTSLRRTYKKTSPKQAMHFKRHAVDFLSV